MNMLKILITGANGQLGSEIKELEKIYSGYEYLFTDIDNLDISSLKSLTDYFATHNPSYIINCAAYTAVDKAEDEPDKAALINIKGAENLAIMSAKYSIPLIHISTDYVFDGIHYKPYTEDFPCSPQSVYGKTKHEGERIVIKTTQKHIIIRTSWLYSSHGNNFVKTILRLGKERNELNVIFDQVGSPTYAYNLAIACLEILNQTINDFKTEIGGIYHFSNEGVCSWYDLALEIMKIAELNCRVKPIETKDYPTKAKRPHYSVLNKSKIKSAFNLEIPHWVESLQDCLKKLAV